MKTLHSHRGFTIVETLVAITILMIAVAGPLVVATKGLTAALYARDQMIASFLAQESMEVIKNARDNNLSAQDPWLKGIASTDTGVCAKAETSCDASALSTPVNERFSPSLQSCGADPCTLYFDPADGYSDSGDSDTAMQTLFSRRYYLTDPGSNNPCGTAAGQAGADPRECQVRVAVGWNEGTVSNEIDLSSELVNQGR